MDFVDSRNSLYRDSPNDWQKSEQDLNDIRFCVKNGDLSKITFAKRTLQQIKDSENPAGKYDLSFDQKDAINAVVSGVKQYLLSGRKVGCLEMILGPPGTGKTTCIMEIEHQLQSLIIDGVKQDVKSIFTASTGVAASINYGQTIYSAANIHWAHWGKTKDNVKLEKDLTENDFVASAELKIVDLIIIDEISMVPHRVLADLDRGLRRLMGNEQPFGGKCILLGGDFLQCKAINCKQLPSLCLDILHGVNRVPSNFNGANLFILFTRRDLVTQHRVDDEQYLEHLTHMRDLTSDTPITSTFLKTLKSFSMQDVLDDPVFLLASTLVTSCYERAIFNWHIALAYKDIVKRPMLYWMCPLKENFTTITAPGLVDVLPHVRQFFIQGAPAMYLQDNPNPGIRVCNGARATMHSLVYFDGIPTTVVAMINRAVTEMQNNDFSNALIEVPMPDAVMLDIENPKHGNILYPTRTFVNNYKTILPGTKTIDIVQHNFQPGFAFTFHKAQGLTLLRVLIMAYMRPGSRYKFMKLSLRALYVALSRVRQGSHIRLEVDFNKIDFDDGSFVEIPNYTHLLQLKHDPDLREWSGNYDSNGRWISTISLADQDAAIRRYA